MVLEIESLHLLEEALQSLEKSFAPLPAYQQSADLERYGVILSQVAERLHDNYPYPHPLYAGQMLKPPHSIARLAYMLAMWINPNNQSIDGGRASSAMEKEAVAGIARMLGWSQHLGHLTSGGTMANLEALWVAGELRPGKKVLASSQAHYTHKRISEVLKLPFQSVPVADDGRIDINALEDILKREAVAVVVATIGTTAIGAVDPLDEIVELRNRYGFRIHVDAAYGGYFVLADNLAPTTRRAFDHLPDVDSLVIDPHKHGLQPYGCGCILFKEASVGRFYQHDSPYTYFSSDDLHLGKISLECSRAGASAVALWATQQLLPMERGGEFAQGMTACHAAALELHQRLCQDDHFMTPFEPQLDIVIWTPTGQQVSAISQHSQAFYKQAALHQLHLAVAHLPSHFFSAYDLQHDQETITCLRSCLMKPDHQAWLSAIYAIIDRTYADLSAN
jgi:glutamate/tyrosine decarboxylase-like PLP-dependent enzyme